MTRLQRSSQTERAPIVCFVESRQRDKGCARIWQAGPATEGNVDAETRLKRGRDRETVLREGRSVRQARSQKRPADGSQAVDGAAAACMSAAMRDWRLEKRCSSCGRGRGRGRGQGARRSATGIPVGRRLFGRRWCVVELCMLMRRRASVGDWETGRGAAVS